MADSLLTHLIPGHLSGQQQGWRVIAQLHERCWWAGAAGLVPDDRGLSVIPHRKRSICAFICQLQQFFQTRLSLLAFSCVPEPAADMQGELVALVDS